ncbi:MAG: NAD-dependent epimerase/dehydratase family protein [Candidatus Firestonebacteria bacterium]
MPLQGKKAFVTGSNGFTGSFLTEELLKRGMEVHCLVRKTSNLRWIGNLNIKTVYGELTKPETLKGLLKGIDYIFHTAGVKQGRNWEDFASVNQRGTKNLLEAAVREAPGLKKFIYVSSMAVMGPSKDGSPVAETKGCKPVTFYGESKLKGEEAVFEFKHRLPVVSLRPPALYGPRDEDMLKMFFAVKMGVKPFFGFRKKYISLCYIDDFIQACVLSAEKDIKSGNAYFIADEQVYSWEDVHKEIAEALHVRAVKLKIPISLVFTTAFLSELVAKVSNRSTLFTRQKVREMLGQWVCDISKAKSELGFNPKYGIKQGIGISAKWYKENNWL